MRHALLPAALVMLSGCGHRAATPPSLPDNASPLTGRPAPPVAFGDWFVGDPVPGLEPGKVYVLDFWASWCGPCIQATPHLQQTAAEFAGRATVVGLTVLDDRNPSAAVHQVLARVKADRHPVRYATTDRATLAAYAVDAFPTAVVIGPDGRIAYRGNPMLVDEVLDRVLAGDWHGRASVAAVDGLADELNAIYSRAESNPKAAATDLTAFEAAHPTTAGRAGYRVSKVAVLLAADRFDDARRLTEELLPRLIERKDARRLDDLRSIWADAGRNPARRFADLGVRAAEGMMTVEGPDDPAALGRLADAHLFAGDKAKALAAADKALAAAPDGSPLKKWLSELRKKCE